MGIVTAELYNSEPTVNAIVVLGFGCLTGSTTRNLEALMLAGLGSLI